MRKIANGESFQDLVGREMELYDIMEDLTPQNIRSVMAENIEEVLKREMGAGWDPSWSVLVPVGADEYEADEDGSLTIGAGFEVYAEDGDTVLATGMAYGLGIAFQEGDGELSEITVTIDDVGDETLAMKKRAAGSLRQEMEAEGYKIDESGYIRSPGKFEAEPYWLPYFYGQIMEGGGSGDFVSDEQGWSVELMELTQEDFDQIPELAEQGFQVGEKIGIEENSQGFVSIINEPEEGWDSWMEEVNKELYPEDEDDGGYGKIGMARLAVKAVYGAGEFKETLDMLRPYANGAEAPIGPGTSITPSRLRERLQFEASPMGTLDALSPKLLNPDIRMPDGRSMPYSDTSMFGGGQGKVRSAEDLGRQAAKKDGWIFGSEDAVRDTLEESKQRYVSDAGELVEQWKDGWKETLHYEQNYQQDLMNMSTAEDEEERMYDLMDREGEFWEGVIDGLAKRGIDVYRMAKEIMGETGGTGVKDLSVDLELTIAFDPNTDAMDAYTVVIGDDVYTMSENADSPQGVNQYAGTADEMEEYLSDPDLEWILPNEAPEGIQRAIERRLEEDDGSGRTGRSDRLWMRIGDSGEYEEFDDIDSAVQLLGDLTEGAALEPEDVRWLENGMGLEVPGFEGQNYISLYWGDANAEPVRGLSDDDMVAFEDAMRSMEE